MFLIFSFNIVSFFPYFSDPSTSSNVPSFAILIFKLMLFEGDGNSFLLVEVFFLMEVFFFPSELYILPEISDRQDKDCLLVAGALP